MAKGDRRAYIGPKWTTFYVLEYPGSIVDLDTVSTDDTALIKQRGG